MSNITSLPSDMIGELLNGLLYHEIINLCQTNRQFRDYCQNNHQKLDKLLLQESLGRHQNNPKEAIYDAINHNNYPVFVKLAKMGADPLIALNTRLLDKVNNIDIILFVLQTVKDDSRLSPNRKADFIKSVIERGLKNKQLFPHLVRDYNNYLTPTLLFNAISSKYPIIDMILDHFDQLDLRSYSKSETSPHPINDCNRFPGYYFLLTLILYTYVYQPNSIYMLANFVNCNTQLQNVILNKPIILDDFDKILISKSTLAHDLVEMYDHRNSILDEIYSDFKTYLNFNPISFAQSAAICSRNLPNHSRWGDWGIRLFKNVLSFKKY